jgi:hypothetical protein
LCKKKSINSLTYFRANVINYIEIYFLSIKSLRRSIMPNIELLEKSMPVAPIRIAALGCRELAEEVDKKLVKFRKELVARKQLSVIPQGYSEESFLVECDCPRFGTGEGKGYITFTFSPKKLFFTAYTSACTLGNFSCTSFIILPI